MAKRLIQVFSTISYRKSSKKPFDQFNKINLPHYIWFKIINYFCSWNVKSDLLDFMGKYDILNEVLIMIVSMVGKAPPSLNLILGKQEGEMSLSRFNPWTKDSSLQCLSTSFSAVFFIPFPSSPSSSHICFWSFLPLLPPALPFKFSLIRVLLLLSQPNSTSDQHYCVMNLWLYLHQYLT